MIDLESANVNGEAGPAQTAESALTGVGLPAVEVAAARDTVRNNSIEPMFGKRR